MGVNYTCQEISRGHSWHAGSVDCDNRTNNAVYTTFYRCKRCNYISHGAQSLFVPFRRFTFHGVCRRSPSIWCIVVHFERRIDCHTCEQFLSAMRDRWQAAPQSTPLNLRAVYENAQSPYNGIAKIIERGAVIIQEKLLHTKKTAVPKIAKKSRRETSSI